MSKKGHTIHVCQDCLFVHANGETENENLEREPLSLLKGMEISLGMSRDEHECQDEAGLTAFERDEDCDCENTTFSWSACEGCGCTLGGSRHALTVWGEADDEDYPDCEKCGEPIDYCIGHGSLG